LLSLDTSGPERTTGASAHVLLIEDQDDVREPNATALEHAGYRVVQASSWSQALAISARDALRVDVIVTDLLMPDDPGVDAFTLLRSRHGSVPVVVFSAYPAAMRLLGDVLDGVVEWLQKPLEVSHVVEAVGRALHHGSA
jgi:DNA-binding NtrC family response regulator